MPDIAPTPVPSPAPAPAPSATPSPAPVPAAAKPPGATPAPEPKGGTPTILAGTDPKPDAAPVADWPDDWRQKASKGDDKTLKRLERYASPVDVANALIAAQNKISAGELKASLPANATPEELSAWRQENGIPAKAEGYLEGLPDGVVIGDDDKALVTLFATDMHARNASPEIVHAAIASYYKVQEQVEAETVQHDQQMAVACEEALRAELGAGYRPMLTGLRNYLATLPKELASGLEGARLADGTPLFANPDAVRWVNNVIRETNPISTVVPGAGADAGKTLADEIKKIDDFMAKDRRAYNKDNAMQARYRELIDIRERQKSRV